MHLLLLGGTAALLGGLLAGLDGLAALRGGAGLAGGTGASGCLNRRRRNVF
jgi:hypothetical protein